MEQNLEDLKTWQDGARRKLENDIEQMKEAGTETELGATDGTDRRAAHENRPS